MPMTNAKEKLKKGLIKEEDIPYMQRVRGSWDNSDVKGAKKMHWTPIDKEYQQNESGTRNMFDWTGQQARNGPNTANKKSPPPPERPVKKLFGLF